MFDHIALGTSHMQNSRKFYDAALKPLGLKRLFDDADLASGYGIDRPIFWIVIPSDEKNASVGNGTHLAFAAPSRRAVNEFHAQALAAGGLDHGAPELCPEYGENYYAAYVFDPDGHKIEAVTRLPEKQPLT